MKTLLAAVVAVLTLAPAWAQYGSSSGSSRSTEDQAYFSHVRPTSISGQIASVQTLPNGDLKIAVRTDYGRKTVILGPADWYKREGINLRVGDNVQVSGFITDDGDIAAGTIRKGPRSFILRNESGAPVWAGTGYGYETTTHVGAMAAEGKYSMPPTWISNTAFKSGTPVSVTGSVTGISLVPAMHGSPAGVHVDLRADDGSTCQVHVGPEWSFVDKNLTIAVGDRVSVRGAQLMHMGKKIVIPSEFTKGGVSVMLRNSDGEVIWRSSTAAGKY